MFKKSLIKTVAAFLCLGVVLMAVPTLNSAEKTPKLGRQLMMRQPGFVLSSLSSLLPSLGTAIFGSYLIVPVSTIPASNDRFVKPTNDITILKPSVRD